MESRTLNHLKNSLQRQVIDQVWISVSNRVLDSAVESVWEWVEERTEECLDADIWKQMKDHPEASVWSFHRESRLASFRLLHELFEENDLIALSRFNEMVSGYRLGDKEAWLVRKPMRLHYDEQGRLHNAEGMCLQYGDGWGCYGWHGVRVPGQIILHPERLTKDDWLNERDLEIRRVIQERLGPERFIVLVGGTRIDRSSRGELIAVDLKDDPERVAHYVHVQDASTERPYLRVPPTVTSVDEAVARTFDLNGQDYRPQQET